MEEKANELRNYLPIYFESKENNEYVEYLTSAYLKNVEAENISFLSSPSISSICVLFTK